MKQGKSQSDYGLRKGSQVSGSSHFQILQVGELTPTHLGGLPLDEKYIQTLLGKFLEKE